MRPHPYLRAYMAGTVVPTVFLLVIVSAFAWFRFSGPSHTVGEGLLVGSMAGFMVFPMAVVPNLWGIWNMLHLASRSRLRLPLAVHGALLPLILFPLGLMLARDFVADVARVRTLAAPFVPVGMAVYYLVWKYIVGFLNQELGIG